MKQGRELLPPADGEPSAGQLWVGSE